MKGTDGNAPRSPDLGTDGQAASPDSRAVQVTPPPEIPLGPTPLPSQPLPPVRLSHGSVVQRPNRRPTPTPPPPVASSPPPLTSAPPPAPEGAAPQLPLSSPVEVMPLVRPNNLGARVHRDDTPPPRRALTEDTPPPLTTAPAEITPNPRRAAPARRPGGTPLPSKPISGRNNLPQHLHHLQPAPPRRRKMVRGVTLSKSALAGIWLMAFALGMVTTVLVERFRPSPWSEPPLPIEPMRSMAQPPRPPGVEIVTLPAPPQTPPATAPTQPADPAADPQR